jgi:hypothetical protein
LLPFTILLAIAIAAVELLDLQPRIGIFPQSESSLQPNTEEHAFVSVLEARIQPQDPFRDGEIANKKLDSTPQPSQEAAPANASPSFLFHSQGQIASIEVLDLEEEGNLERASRARSYQVHVESHMPVYCIAKLTMSEKLQPSV